LIGLAHPITAVLFQRGAFGAADVQATATLTALYTIGLPSYALIKLYVPTLYALRRPWVPVGVSLGVIGLKVISNVLLWRAGAPYWFLALTTGLAAVLNAAITSAVLRRTLGGFGGLRLGSTLAKVALASAAMIGSCFAVGAVGVAVGGFAVLVLAAQITAGIAVLWGVLVALRVPEVRELHDTVLRRLGRGRDTTA
jgi:putative peptidoglycan lipid II flippase